MQDKDNIATSATHTFRTQTLPSNVIKEVFFLSPVVNAVLLVNSIMFGGVVHKQSKCLFGRRWDLSQVEFCGSRTLLWRATKVVNTMIIKLRYRPGLTVSWPTCSERHFNLYATKLTKVRNFSLPAGFRNINVSTKNSMEWKKKRNKSPRYQWKWAHPS